MYDVGLESTCYAYGVFCLEVCPSGELYMGKGDRDMVSQE